VSPSTYYTYTIRQRRSSVHLFQCVYTVQSHYTRIYIYNIMYVFTVVRSSRDIDWSRETGVGGGEGFVGVSLWYNDVEGATLPAGHYNEGDGDGDDYDYDDDDEWVGLRRAVLNIIHVSPDDPMGCGRMALFNTARANVIHTYTHIRTLYTMRDRGKWAYSRVLRVVDGARRWRACLLFYYTLFSFVFFSSCVFFCSPRPKSSQ